MKYLEAKRLDTERMENKALGGPGSNKGAGAETGARGPSASPQARQLATELGVDLASVEGTGSGGMVTAGDVRKAHEDQGRGD